jgi:hypothetical protein
MLLPKLSNIRLVSGRSYNETYCEKTCVSQRYGRINGLIPATSGKVIWTHKYGFDRVSYQPARRNLLNTFFFEIPLILLKTGCAPF